MSLPDPPEEVLELLRELKRRQLRLRLCLKIGPTSDLDLIKLESDITYWGGSIIGYLITHGPRDLGWLENLVNPGAVAWIARVAETLPSARGPCRGCGKAVLAWEAEPRCPQCGRLEGLGKDGV